MPRIRTLAVMILLAATFPARGDDEANPLLMDQPRADYQARRKDLMARLSAGATRDRGATIAVVRGEDDAAKQDFEEGRFRQTNPFAYLTGVNIPGAWLVLRPDENRSILYVPPKSRRSALNDEDDRPDPGPEAAEALGFDAVEPTSRLLADVFSALNDPLRPRSGGGGVVFALSPNPSADDSRLDARFVRFLREGAPNSSYRDLAPMLGEMRKVKTTAELDLLKKAIAITGNAQDETIRTLRPGVWEMQVEGKILGAFLDGGSDRPGFKSIVGSGPNSTIPHYFLSARRMADGDLVVVDIGAEYKLYTADITRTYPVNGKFSPRQREIYQLVLDAQKAAEAEVKPGDTRLATMTGFVRDYLSKSPLRAKDAKGQEQTMDHFFIHGLGHYLGMDVHDVGDTTKPLQPGEVFTIEPGIYIKSEALGVRIEDDYLVTEAGLVKLSEGIASDPDAIEAKMARAREEARAPSPTADGGGR